MVGLRQRSHIYYPQRADLERLMAAAANVGASAWLDGSGKYQGWWFVNERATGDVGVVVFHGNAGMAWHRQYFVDCLFALPFADVQAVAIFEYPGYGPRDGAPSERALIETAIQAVEPMLSEVEDKRKRVYLIGESLGAGVACQVAAHFGDRIAGLFLATPFSSLADAARVHYPYLPVRWFLRDRYDNVKALKNYRGPVFVLAAEEDRVVPASLAQRLYEAYEGPKKMWIEKGADHNSLVYSPSAEWWIGAWQFLLESGGATARRP